MVDDRIAQIEENLELLYEQLGAVEQGALLTPDPQAKIQAKQRIRKEIKPEIQKYELEYLQVLQQNASELAEEEAQAVIDVLIEEIPHIQSLPSSSSPEILEILRRIEDKLNEPGTTAAAKLKGTFSLMPPFVNLSYETELDTENFFRKHFPTFTAATRRLRGKKS
jgi:N-methylhydantoinase B/oxoprolinase/acetone carboxylase alpha subunit